MREGVRRTTRDETAYADERMKINAPVILSVPPVILSVPPVILSVPPVILSEAKDPPRGSGFFAGGCSEKSAAPDPLMLNLSKHEVIRQVLPGPRHAARRDTCPSDLILRQAQDERFWRKTSFCGRPCASPPFHA